MTNKKRCGTMALLAALALSLILAGGWRADAGEQYPNITLQLGHNDPDTPDNHLQYYAVQLRDMLAERSGGSIVLEIYPSSQLGGERDMIEGMQMGTMDMALSAGVAVGIFWPEYMVYDLPYMFADLDEVYKVMDSIGLEINQRMYENVGVKVLSNGIGGFRHVGNNLRPIRTVGDMKGMKIRTPEQILYMETFKILGANPTPMAWAEVFTGMQQGTIDAYEVPTSVHFTNRFYEVSKYYSETKHFFSPIALMISGSLWESMNEKTRNLLSECSLEAARRQRKFVADNEARQRQELIDRGMQVNTDVDIAGFQAAMRPVYDMFRDQIGSELIDAVIAKAKE